MKNILFDNVYRKNITTHINKVFLRDGKSGIVPTENFFYPKGGGQKGDKGIILCNGKQYTICDTIRDQYSDDEVILLTEEPIDESLTGNQVEIYLDWDFRYIQMRFHSIVHLHHCILEEVIGKALEPPITSDLQEDFAFNRYGKGIQDMTQEICDIATDKMKTIIQKGGEIKNYPDTEKMGYRYWEFKTWKIGCGGTHLRDIKEIGEFEAQFSRRKGAPFIKFTLI